jgi:hypothetical protein
MILSKTIFSGKNSMEPTFMAWGKHFGGPSLEKEQNKLEKIS